MGQIAARSKDPPYRITSIDGTWQVMRPHAALAHAFNDLDAALAFVRVESGGSATSVEIVSGTFYMLKHIEAAR